jgi:hypothetical protein
MKWFLIGFFSAVALDKLWWKLKGKELYDKRTL